MRNISVYGMKDSIQTIKMSILSNLIYKFNVISIKYQYDFYNYKQQYLKLIWKSSKRIANVFFEKQQGNRRNQFT